MFPSWRQYGSDRPNVRLNFCERCGAVVDGDPDSTLQMKFKKKPRTRCADDLIENAARELDGEST